MALFTELKRRNVFKVGVAYAIVGWVLIQIAAIVLPTFDTPRWVQQSLTFIIILGFPLALFLAWAYELTPGGIRKSGAAPPDETSPSEPPAASAGDSRRGEIRFCTTRDDIRLAYTVNGSGPPVVKTGNWISHQELEWDNPLMRPMIRDLSARYSLISYDGRGTGLSDREITELSLDTMVEDMETVVDANQLEKFSIVANSQSCMVAIAYTERHPERVANMVLFGGFVQNFRTREEIDAIATLFAQSWGQANPATRQIFTTSLIPDATKEEFDALNEFQRHCGSPEIIARLFRTIHGFDVRELAKKVTVPTLVMHSRDEPGVPFEYGREMASLIPGARFIALESRNHILLKREPAYKRFLEEACAFIDHKEGN